MPGFNLPNASTGALGTSVDVSEMDATAVVTESEGIASNDNDTTLPTSAAVKDYVDSNAGIASVVADTTPQLGGNLDLNGNGIGDAGDLTKELTFDLSGATTAKTATVTSSHTDDRTITLPDATDTLVGKATIDTLTNKSIDAANNTVSNLDVADFAAAAIVTEGEGISSNDNDTTLPTSAAVKDYVDSAGGGVADHAEAVNAWQDGKWVGGIQRLSDTNMFTQNADGTFVDDRIGVYRLGTAGTSGTGTTCSQDTDSVYITNPWDCDQYFSAIVWVKGTTNQDIFFGVGNSAATGSNVAADATLVDQHIGFFIQDGTIYASNADGSTQTKTDVSSGITLAAYNVYEWTLDADTNIVFKINGTTVATHTTNLPTTEDTNCGVAVGIETQENDFKSMHIGHGMFWAIDLTNATGA